MILFILFYLLCLVCCCLFRLASASFLSWAEFLLSVLPFFASGNRQYAHIILTTIILDFMSQ